MYRSSSTNLTTEPHAPQMSKCHLNRDVSYSKTQIGMFLLFVGPLAPSAAMFPMECIPQLFIDQHHNNCRRFCDFQERTILRNLELFDCNAEELKEELRPLQEQFYKRYVQMFEVKRIHPELLRYRQADVVCTNLKFCSFL